MEKERKVINKNTLDKSVSKHIISCSCGLIPAGALVLYLARNMLPQRFMEGFLVGSVAGLANLMFLSMIIKAIVNTEGADKKAAILGFAGINASLFGLLFPAYMQWVNIPALALGFTMVLGILLAGTYSVINKRKG